jgi:hypothetical protein
VSNCLPTELGICAVRVGLTSGLHYAAWQRVSKTQTYSAPMPSRAPVPRQHISAIARSIGFLGHPSRQGMWPGCLLHMWHLLPLRRAVDGLLRSVCPFSVTLGRHCTPHPSHRVVYPRTHVLRGRMGTFPFGPALVCHQTDISRFAGSNSRRLRAFVFLTLVTCSRRHRSRLAVCPLSPLALPRLITSRPQ